MSRPPIQKSPGRLPGALALLVLAALLVSGMSPLDRGTWALEVAPVVIAAPVLLATWRRYPLTPLLQRWHERQMGALRESGKNVALDRE